jgi:hypothetical protein
VTAITSSQSNVFARSDSFGGVTAYKQVVSIGPSEVHSIYSILGLHSPGRQHHRDNHIMGSKQSSIHKSLQITFLKQTGIGQ